MRLAPNPGHLFSGHQIAREKPIEFSFNGIRVQGLEGDTVLSALIADGVLTAGALGGALMGLNENLDLPIYPADTENAVPLPISRTPAFNGAAFVTEPGRRAPVWPRLPIWLDRFRPRNLKARFGVPLALPGPWLETPDTVEMRTDTLIIGGGMAGLTAAAETCEAGKDVTLLERRGYCGGDAPLFGRVEGEDAPETVIEGYVSALSGRENFEALCFTEALTVQNGVVGAHQVRMENGVVVSRLLSIKARKIIIATGMAETLPVFPGNRLPGVSGLIAAFHLASGYGAGLADSAAVATSINVGYRLALLMQDAGIDVAKISDSRLSPQSRFIEFSKAYGIKFEQGLKPREARYTYRVRTATLDLDSSWGEESISHSAPLAAGSVLLGGGWQPRLSLWQQAGGDVAFDASSAAIAARGSMSNIYLAGSCAGLQSTSSVIRSGNAVAAAVLGGKLKRVVDRPIDAAFETPDDKLIIAHGTGEAPAFLSNGPSMVEHDAVPNRPHLFAFANNPAPLLSAAERALSLGDLVALQVSGDAAIADFNALVGERVVVSRAVAAGRSPNQPGPEGEPDKPHPIPSYLAERFGKGAGLCQLTATGGGTFETGNLIFNSSDQNAPDQAIGVIVDASDEKDVVALVAKDAQVEGRRVAVKTTGSHGAAVIGGKI